MRKAVKVGNQTFLFLDRQTLLIDRDEMSSPYPFPIDLAGKILDFWFDSSTRSLRVFTTEGDAISVVLDSEEDAVVLSFREPFISASVYRNEILAISAAFRPKLLNCKGELVHDYPEIKKGVRFCLLNGQLKILGDSSFVYVKKSKIVGWEKHRFRDVFVKGIVDTNRQGEFGIVTARNTRILRDGFQKVLRPWAQNTVALLQCPGSRRTCAHLDEAGFLRIGDIDSDFTIQEGGRTALCWELGVLWARSVDARWKRVVIMHNGAVYDLRPTHLEGLESPLVIEDNGKVLAILDALRERPALAKELLGLLPAIAQNLTDGIIVKEVKQSLSAYVQKSEEVHRLLGQIDLVLDQKNGTQGGEE
jgi:hypothetical protein